MAMLVYNISYSKYFFYNSLAEMKLYGSAYIINDWSDAPNAIIMSFYSGIEGGTALANILTGKVNPSGKLPFTVALDDLRFYDSQKKEWVLDKSYRLYFGGDSKDTMNRYHDLTLL
jgi:hypothetical protein